MPGYVNTVDFAAWHIPCYSRHNCNGRSRFAGSHSSNSNPEAVMAGASLGADLVRADSSSGAVSAFLLFLLLASLLGGVAVASSLISRKGYLRPLNVFILFVLASDWLLISTAFPMQALRLSSSDVSQTACATWMYLELVALATRSWLMPSTIFAYYLHDGLIPLRRLLLICSGCLAFSLVLCLPPLISSSTLLDTSSCAIRHASSLDSAAAAALIALSIYVSVVAFALPAIILTTAFIRWTKLKNHINVGEFHLPDDDDDDDDEEEEEEEEEEEVHGKEDDIEVNIPNNRSDNNFLALPKTLHTSFSRKSSAILGESFPTLAINRIRDRDFPAVMYVFAITQAVFWSPFALLLLISPWLTSPLPAPLSVSMTLLGYAQCAITPVLTVILVERVQKSICYCKCNSRQQNAK